MEKIRTHKDLRVFQLSFELAMEIFELSKSFPIEEKYSLTDQIRRSSRSVPTNISEAFRKRRYPKSFVNKLIECDGEASETTVWLNLALDHSYINSDMHTGLISKYTEVSKMLNGMINAPEKFCT